MRDIFSAGLDAVIDLLFSLRPTHYHRRFAPASTRSFGIAAEASDPYADFTGVNNANRMRIGIDVVDGDRNVTTGLD